MFRFSLKPTSPLCIGITLGSSVRFSAVRSIWAERRLEKLERQANDPAYRSDPRRQAELYRVDELYKSGNYQALIHRYENQPQLGSSGAKDDIATIQNDRECLKAYVSALSREGQIDRISDRILELLKEKRDLSGSNSSSSSSPLSSRPIDSKDHWLLTDVNEWERAIGGRFPKASSSRGAVGSSSLNRSRTDRYGGAGEQRLEPIQVTIAEAWSWSKFSRKLLSRIVYGILLMTGLSVILDQQGIIKSAGMAAAEVEPHNLQNPVTFDDVQGVDEAKNELEDIVSFLKEPKKFLDIGGKLPKGILLYGPPGTGKTHLARAIAGEAGVPFFQMSGSEFDELYVGVGARRIRELFTAAKAKAPCIVFIDEIDAVGSKRNSRDQSYMRQTLNQLLVELDGFSSNEGVIFIAATNTPEALDKALIRPGRFDRHVAVPLPDVQGRAKILQVHMKGVTVTSEVDTNTIARGTPGFSGADLSNLINQAAIRASKEMAPGVRNEDLEWAKDRIIMGAERKSAVITEHSKKLTAYHEGGHALVAMYTAGADKLHKVTVIPRGSALGVTVQLPEADRTTHTKRELNAMIDVCLGGRAAEEIIFGSEEITTGASSDLEKASALAREMVTTYGMSDKIGLVSIRSEELEKAAPNTKLLIDTEMKMLLENGYSRASNLLKSHKEELHRLAKALIEYETLTFEEVKVVVKGGDLNSFRKKQ
ncbi:hypothetical protein HDU97_009694 [Phlyctochytrium planicorne]|nr:hypothetical protein HDU97_009694 [Phlyctochytrium planicorne]